MPEGPAEPTGPFGPGKPVVKKIGSVYRYFLLKDNFLPGTPAAPFAPGAPTKYCDVNE